MQSNMFAKICISEKCRCLAEAFELLLVLSLFYSNSLIAETLWFGVSAIKGFE